MFNVIDPHTAFLIPTQHKVFVCQDRMGPKMGRGWAGQRGYPPTGWPGSPGQVLSEKYAKLVGDHCSRARATTGSTDRLLRLAHVWLQLHR